MRVFFARAFLLALLAAPACANATNYTFPDGSPGFSFSTAGGTVNPGVLVGFNPQPEPPGDVTRLNLRDPTQPLFVAPSGGSYIVTVSLFPGTPSLLLPAVPEPGRTGMTQTFCDGSVSVMCDGSVFVLSLGLFGPGGVIDWAAFNPQPDPPGVFLSYSFSFSPPPIAAFALDLPATFALSIMEDGVPLTFAVAPEAETWVLMGLGFGSLGLLGWRRSRARPA